MAQLRSNHDILKDILIDSSDDESTSSGGDGSEENPGRAEGTHQPQSAALPSTSQQDSDTSSGSSLIRQPRRKIGVRQFVSPSTGSHTADRSEEGHAESTKAPPSSSSSVRVSPEQLALPTATFSNGGPREGPETVAELQNEELLSELEKRLAQRRAVVEAEEFVVQPNSGVVQHVDPNDDIPYSEDDTSAVTLESSSSSDELDGGVSRPQEKDANEQSVMSTVGPSSYIPSPTPMPELAQRNFAQVLGRQQTPQVASQTSTDPKPVVQTMRPVKSPPPPKPLAVEKPLPDPRKLSGGPRMYAEALHQRKNLAKWVEQQKHEEDEEEMQECSFAPRTAKIPSMNNGPDGVLPRSNRSAEVYKSERLAFIGKIAERTNQAVLEEQNLPFKPEIGPKSKEIVQQCRSQNASGMSVTNRLYAESAHKKLSLLQRQEEHREGLLKAGGGKERFDSEEEAIGFVERLYRLDRNRQLKVDRLREAIFAEEIKGEAGKRKIESWEVVNRLTEKEKRNFSEEFQDPDLTFKPKIDAMSAHLAARVRNAKFRAWFSYFLTQGDQSKKLDETQIETSTITLDSHLNSFSGEQWFDFNGCGCPPPFQNVATCVKNQLPLFLTLDDFVDACDTAGLHPWKLEEPPQASANGKDSSKEQRGHQRDQLLRHFPFSPPLSQGTKEITKNRSRNKENIHVTLYDQWKKTYEKTQAQATAEKKKEEAASRAQEERREAYWKAKLSTSKPLTSRADSSKSRPNGESRLSEDILDRIEKSIGMVVEETSKSQELAQEGDNQIVEQVEQVIQVPHESPEVPLHQSSGEPHDDDVTAGPLKERVNGNRIISKNPESNCQSANMTEILTRKRGHDRKSALREMGRQLAAKQFQQRRY